MIKVARLLRRKRNVTPAAFHAAWSEAYADGLRRLLSTAPGVLRYAQSFPLPVPRPVGAAAVEEIDCIDEVWCESLDAAAALFDADGFRQTLVPQEQALVDPMASEVLSGTVHRKLDRPLHGGDDAVKMMLVGARRAELSSHAFRRYWLEVHSAIALGNPSLQQPEGGVRRLEFCPNMGVAFGGLPASAGDALVAAWFDRAAHAQAEFAGDYYRDQLKPDEPKFSDLSRSFGLLTREVLVWQAA